MFRQTETTARHRRGAFMVLAFFALMATMGFVAFSIDTGHIALNKTIMQNGVDAAALAAAMEITNAIENAPPEEIDPTAYAREQAKTVASETAAQNGVYVDPDVDVELGLRWFNPATGRFEIQWGVEPANTVKVRARRDNDDVTAPDGKLPMMFAGVLGETNVQMSAEAIAYIESRDISVVLDFSGSMRYDSLFYNESIQKLGAYAIEENLEQMYAELELADGAIGTLDHVDPDNSASTRTGDAKWLVVHGNPPSADDPQIDVTFMYRQAHVESDMPFETVRLKFGNSWQTFSGLNATSGTFAGTGSYSNDNIDAVEVSVPTGSGEPVVQSGGLGSGGPNATVSVDHTANEVTVTLNSNSLDRIRIYYTDGSRDTWNSPSGQHEVVNGDSGKTIEDVRVYSNSGHNRRFRDFNDGLHYVETFEDDNAAVKSYFQLASTPWPFKNFGRSDQECWDRYINYVRSDWDVRRGGLREMYGGSTLVHYLSETYPKHSQTPELAKTSHYPFHAVRKGNELFVDFLDNLGFGDHVGLVSYDQERRIEDNLIEDGLTVDITTEPVSNHYDEIKTIMRYKQASNYFSRTNIGGGIREAIAMLETHGRQGARPTILLMTDGNANVHENEAGMNSLHRDFVDDGYYALPQDFDWSTITFNDGTAYEVTDDGSYENQARLFALSQALKAAEKGYTVHTLAVGAGADRNLMRAIAVIGGGEFISVQGDLSVADLLDEVQASFYRIAALVPPARLANPDEVAE